jgi:hypothetical protein
MGVLSCRKIRYGKASFRYGSLGIMCCSFCQVFSPTRDGMA